MATDKRDRQRANREVRRALEKKQQRRKTTLRRIRRWGTYAVLIILALVIINQFAGDSSADALSPLLGL